MKISDYIYKGHITYKANKNYLAIRIPMKRSVKNLIILSLATASWSISLFFLIYFFTNKFNHAYGKYILVLSFIIWTIVGLIGASIFMWIFFGRERIIISKDYLITEKPLVFFYRRSFYNIKEISNIKIDKEIYRINRNNEWIEQYRTILKFDTPQKSPVFARNIDTKDAEYVLFLLAKSNYFEEQQFAIVQ